jgi:hypothetical protein
MKLEQNIWTEKNGWKPAEFGSSVAQLLLIFGGSKQMADAPWFAALRRAYPNAIFFGASTAGEIAGTRVYDDTLVATAITFEHTKLALARVQMHDVKDSTEAGEHLANALPHEGLVHVLVMSDGTTVNGSELVRGMSRVLPRGVQVTGGLAGDGSRFEKTLIVAGETFATGSVAAIGFYGDRLNVGYGSLGGWDPFGPERKITRSEGNVLFELDGEPALDLYKSYLGEHAAGLPATGLFFPLNIQREGEKETLVRTIQAIDEEKRSVTFFGDVPMGATTQLMKANFDRLVEGAAGAARGSGLLSQHPNPELALLVSCVGRKIVLKQRTEEEVEAVQEVLGDRTVMTGFYSYGEISPTVPNGQCHFHNQTMTITTFSERL